MAVPDWDEVYSALEQAIKAAFPLQVAKVADQRVAGIGLHIDCYHGSAGLYLLPESAAESLPSGWADNLGDWPISTDWNLDDDYSRAFAEHWGPWDAWFSNNIDATLHDDSDEGDLIGTHLMLAACLAMKSVEESKDFQAFPKSESFKIIIAEHDEPVSYSVERYPLWREKQEIRFFDWEE